MVADNANRIHTHYSALVNAHDKYIGQKLFIIDDVWLQMPIINFSKYSPLLNSGYCIIYFPNTYILTLKIKHCRLYVIEKLNYTKYTIDRNIEYKRYNINYICTNRIIIYCTTFRYRGLFRK